MVRLSDLHPEEAEGMRNVQPIHIEPGAWITPKPLAESKIALLTTTGMHRREDPPFVPGALDYRLIPGDVDPADLVLAHVSPNWDRTGMQADVNVVLPIDRLRELAEAGEIGHVAQWHYSVMGGLPYPDQLEPSAREMGRLMKQEGVGAIVLCPV